jgi:hypothetical protein
MAGRSRKKASKKDYTAIRITGVRTERYPEVIVSTNEGKTYHADLSSFKPVHCFPKTFTEWKQVFPDFDGIDLVWPGGFEIHVTQAIDCAMQHKPPTKKRKAA